MKELQPFIPAGKIECPKCLNGYMQLKMYGIDEEEYIEVTCGACGYTWNMETADSGKKQVILEEPGDHIPEKSALDLLKENEKVLKEDDETKLAPVGGVVKE